MARILIIDDDPLVRFTLRQVLGRAEDGSIERKGGVMAVVVAGGIVRRGDRIRVELPSGEHSPLIPV